MLTFWTQTITLIKLCRVPAIAAISCNHRLSIPVFFVTKIFLFLIGIIKLNCSFSCIVNIYQVLSAWSFAVEPCLRYVSILGKRYFQLHHWTFFSWRLKLLRFSYHWTFFSLRLKLLRLSCFWQYQFARDLRSQFYNDTFSKMFSAMDVLGI